VPKKKYSIAKRKRQHPQGRDCQKKVKRERGRSVGESRARTRREAIATSLDTRKQSVTKRKVGGGVEKLSNAGGRHSALKDSKTEEIHCCGVGKIQSKYRSEGGVQKRKKFRRMLMAEKERVARLQVFCFGKENQKRGDVKKKGTPTAATPPKGERGLSIDHERDLVHTWVRVGRGGPTLDLHTNKEKRVERCLS